MARRCCTSLWRWGPPEWAEPSRYISGRFNIGTQMSSPSATTNSSLTDPGSLKISLASLLSRIAFFSESDSTPCALLFSSSQGPVRKKQQGRGSQCTAESKLTSAQSPRASLSPHWEVSPVLFSHPDQRPSASASDLVLFGWSDEELNGDSMSLAASEASGAVRLRSWPRPPAFVRSQRCQGRVGCQTSPHPLESGRRAESGVVSIGRAISQPSVWVVPAGAPSGPSLVILAVLSWSSRQAHEIMALPPTTLASLPLPHPPSPWSTALKKRGTRRCPL